MKSVIELLHDSEVTVNTLVKENAELKERVKAAKIATKSAPAQTGGMTSDQANAAYNKIDPNDCRARAAFRAKHAVALGLKR